MPDVIEYEVSAFSPAEIIELEALGHHLKPVARPYGDMQAVSLNKTTRTLSAASDKRGEGSAQVMQ